MLDKLREQAGYTIVEGLTVAMVLVFILAATYNLLEAVRLMNRQAEDGFRAQDEGRGVLTEIGHHLRPAENMNLTGAPQLYADNQGRFIDVRVDTEDDTDTEIVRIALDRDAKQIKMYVDYQDAQGRFNFQVANQPYATYYAYPTVASTWDTSMTIADKVVNAPPDGTSTTPWSAQTNMTDPVTDYRLFTFFGNNFVEPVNTVALGSVWINYVKGVKIYVLSDIEPSEIPSPFGIETDVNLRNIGG